MDFGLAKLVAPDPGTHQVTVTNTEFAVGTPGYMCPEQARGEEMDSRGDLYSVGVILYELLTGRLPFAGRSTMDMLLAHATEDPPAFARIGAALGVPRAVEDVVQACLAKDPGERPATARELAERFEAALGASQPAPSSSATAPAVVPGPRLPPRSSVVARKLRPAPSPSSVSGAFLLPPESGVFDPLAVVHHLEAWMPEKIATVKLRGFIHDVGGEVVESVPGRIRVRLGGKGCIYTTPNRGFSWLGLGRRSGTIDMELRLHRPDTDRDTNQLRITVVLRSPGSDVTGDVAWQSVFTQIFCDLRAYLMGQNGPVSSDAVG
jgi:serine/threonine-protein kinase